MESTVASDAACPLHFLQAPTIFVSQTFCEKEVRRLLDHYPLPPNFCYDYGTAGFRYEHSLLPCIFVRMGIFCCLRSSSLDGEEVGMMVTASHNPSCDNGMKLIDSHGGMLDSDGEILAVQMANNASSTDAVLLQFSKKKNKMVVHVGRDTRVHSRCLANLTIRTMRACGARVVDHGILTTPQLHFLVMHSNPHKLYNTLSTISPGGEVGYFTALIGGYAALIRTAKSSKQNRRLVVDCACGVGGPKILILKSMLRLLQREHLLDNVAILKLNAVNLPGEGPLNEHCGAEHVQKNQVFPKIYTDEGIAGKNLVYIASLDGDADRIIFHYKKNCGDLQFHLLDGDKIAVLISGFIQEELRALQVDVPEVKGIRCGVVQTAYANGSSTLFLTNVVKTNVIVAKTGVKFVHAAAHDNFDVGVYFEANGHGTVLFGHKFYQLLSLAESRFLPNNSKRDRRSIVAWLRLRALPTLINQAVGDALSNLLLVDAILLLRKWDLTTWNNLYTDVPSRQCKVKVLDRSVIVANENETRTIAPTMLQPALDAAVLSSSVKLGGPIIPRAFVRPSGTENVVRVYAEASTQSEADTLALEAAILVYKFCGGTGEEPNSFASSKL